MQEKHGVQILRTPPEILIAFLKTWDEIAAEEWRRTRSSRKCTIPARLRLAGGADKRFYFPPYSFVANYYLPEKQRQRSKERTADGSLPLNPAVTGAVSAPV